jgi:hypothetical protein
MKNCILIGKNTDRLKNLADGTIVIGNFSEEEVETEFFNDCILVKGGHVIIKKDVIDFLRLDIEKL